MLSEYYMTLFLFGEIIDYTPKEYHNSSRWWNGFSDAFTLVLAFPFQEVDKAALLWCNLSYYSLNWSPSGSHSTAWLFLWMNWSVGHCAEFAILAVVILEYLAWVKNNTKCATRLIL